LNLHEISVRPVVACDEARFQSLLDAHHYLGSLPKIGHTLWYVVTWRGQWLALLNFCAAAWNSNSTVTGPNGPISRPRFV